MESSRSLKEPVTHDWKEHEQDIPRAWVLVYLSFQFGKKRLGSAHYLGFNRCRIAA
jgi:hypothetical protein